MSSKIKFLFIITLVILSWGPNSFGTPIPPREGSSHWFKQPTQANLTPRDSRIREVSYRADRPRVVYRNRYFPEVSGREYLDCAAYKYVDCRNYTFCRCWQCRFYQYNFEDAGY